MKEICAQKSPLGDILEQVELPKANLFVGLPNDGEPGVVHLVVMSSTGKTTRFILDEAGRDWLIAQLRKDGVTK